MILDGHIHLGRGKDTPGEFQRKLKAAGVSGGIVISEASHGRPGTLKARLGRAIEFSRGNANLYPFFWIEPMEKDALKQVDQAIAMGAKGFKVIVTNYPPYDPVAMKVFRRIAARGKPLMFHTGILWDDGPSSMNNRPANWECMLDIRGIRFSTAHISWPWVDENLAVYGKLESVRRWRNEAACEMFIDTTRGTPDIYRHEALFKVFKIGYQVEGNVWFGTDCHVDGYDVPRARKMISDDTKILKKLGLSPRVVADYYANNLKRFVEG
jgi:predicted TIM-barrel fold metal-dependent hydrolase